MILNCRRRLRDFTQRSRPVIETMGQAIGKLTAVHIRVTNPRLALSAERQLVYIMRGSGCQGHTTEGSVERIGPSSIIVYNEHGEFLEYFSGDALRSWCVADMNGDPIEGWHSIAAEDGDRMRP